MDPLERFTPRRIETTRGVVECAIAGSGPTLLSLHGAMGGWDQSALLGEVLAPAGYRVVAVSRPGYLGTPLTSGPTPDAQADLLAALLDALAVRDAGVLAVSGGGPSALAFARRHASRCRALVLASTTGAPLTTPLPLRVRLLRLAARSRWLVRRLARRGAGGIDEALQRAVPDDALRARTLADPISRALLTRLLLSTREQLADRLPGTFADIDWTRRATYELEAIATPTLVLHGGRDRVVPFGEHGAVLAARLPQAQLVTAEDGDHVFLFTHRSLVSNAAAAFLAGVLA